MATGTDILALSVDGLVDAYSNGININTGGTLPSIGIAGTVGGGYSALINSGTVNSLTAASGAQINAPGGTGIYNEGAFTGTILNGGTITGYGSALHNSPAGQIAALTNTGTITADYAVRNAGTITTLTNQASGSLQGGRYGVVVESGGSIGTLTNAGAISGYNGIVQAGAITTLDNNGGLIQGAGNAVRVESTGTITLLSNSGTLAGANAIESHGTIGTLTNSGTISGAGDWGIYQGGNSIGTLTNAATGSITATGHGVGIPNATVGTIDNAGLIRGTNGHGLYLEGSTLTALSNSGTISGRYLGVHGWASSIGSITDSGTIEASDSAMILNTTGTIINTTTGSIRSTTTGHAITLYGDTGLLANHGTISSPTGYGILGLGGTLTAITNTGTIEGSRGIHSEYRPLGTITNSGTITGTEHGMVLHDTGTLENTASGVIRSTVNASAIFLYGNTSQISNDGLISGVTEGIAQATGLTTTLTNTGRIEGGSTALSISGTTEKIINTGVIAYTGAGTGPALVVGPGGVLGDATGARGPALESTGASALLSGRIVIEGTIYHGFTIENQNVEVSAAGGTGTFSGGTLDVADGNLSLLDGRINLGSDISVTAGSGSVFNESTLAFSGAPTIHGNFTQLNVGSLISVFDGPTAATLLLDGVATFDGLFGLELDESSLKDNQTFNLLMFDSYLGQFSTFSINGNALASAGPGRWSHNSFILKEEWSPTTMRITVTAAPASVPEPGTMGVASLLISFGFAISRRRTPSKS